MKCSLIGSILILLGFVLSTQAYQLIAQYDSYPWTKCSPFEASKKNCPVGEACLKLKSFSTGYAWNWAMRCQSREEYIQQEDKYFYAG
uniref:Secreted protein n=1 Tax=Lepeophtheirus salmonis TaxID=72036 RepID=A0A0K2TXF3_LEPSM